MIPKIIKLTKLNGAQRQLAEAIRLFFERRDPVAIHTLACAARQVLHDLAKAKGFSSILSKSASLIGDEKKRDLYLKSLTATANFLKHGRTRGAAAIDFHPGVNEALIFDGVETFRRLRSLLFHEGEVFSRWYYLKNPDIAQTRKPEMP